MAASFMAVAECDNCDAEEEIRVPVHPMYDGLCAGNYRTHDNPAGWELRKGKLLCCECADAMERRND